MSQSNIRTTDKLMYKPLIPDQELGKPLMAQKDFYMRYKN